MHADRVEAGLKEREKAITHRIVVGARNPSSYMGLLTVTNIQSNTFLVLLEAG